MKKLICLTALAILSSPDAGADGTTFTWNVDGGGTWEMGANWTAVGPGPNTYPDAQNDVAIFGNIFTGAGAAVIDLSSGMPHEDMGILHFEATGGSGHYQIDNLADDNNLEMNASPGNAQWIVDAGANNPVTYSGPRMKSNLDIQIATGEMLTCYGGLDQSGGVFGINYMGPGNMHWEATGNNSTGASTIQGGLLEIQFTSTGTAPQVAFAGDVSISGGTLKHLMFNNQLATATVNMTLSGGTWDLNGLTESIQSFTFTGGTFAAGGNLTLNAATALTMRNTTLDTTLSLNGGMGQIVVFDATNNGTATIAGPSLSMGVNSKTFNIGSGTADIDMTISAPMIGVGGALDKTGAGVLELTGANTYTGGTTVSAGTLLVNGSIGNGMTMVSSGATLGGTGTIGTVAGVVTNSGNVSPGTSPGTLTINGSYTQTASGALNIELLSPTSFDQLKVNTFGLALDGTLNLELLQGHSLYGNHTLTIVDNTAGTGIMGSFATINKLGFPALSTATVTINSNTVVLALFVPQAPVVPANSVAYSAPVLSSAYQNTLNFMNHLSRIRPRASRRGGKSSVAHLENLPSNTGSASSSRALAAILPNIAIPDASNSTALASGMWDRFNQNKQSQIVAASKNSTKVESPSTSLRIDPSTNRSWGVFADAIGSLGRVYRTHTQDPFRYQSVGGLIGFDYVGDRFGIGLSPGYEYLQAKTLNHQSKFHIQSAEGTAFGTFLPVEGKDFFIDIIGGGACQWYHFERQTPAGKVTGSPRGWQGNIYSDVGYTFSTTNASFTPFVGLGYVHVHVDSYHEKGSIFQRFNIGKQTLNSLRSSLGATASYAVNRNNFSFIPEARFLWQREFLNHNQKVAFASTPLLINSQMQVFGLGRNTLFAGTLLRFLFNHKIEVDASYDYEWNNKFHSHLFLVGLEKRF